MIGATFKLDFISDGRGQISISEPVGFDTADFVLEQDAKKYARDVSFSGGENKFTFYRMGNHAFDDLIYYNETFGFESEVKLIIELDGLELVVGDLDFQTARTDQLEYFECNVIQDTKQQIIKRRHDVKVDLFSNEDLDGNPITPVAFENILIKAKPTRQGSILELSDVFDFTEQESGIRGSETWYMNPYQVLLKSEIEDTYTPFQTHDRGNIFRIIKAQNNLSDLKIELDEISFYLMCENSGSANGSLFYELSVWWGPQTDDDDVPDNKHVFFSGEVKIDNDVTVTGNYTYTIPFLNREDAVYIAFKVKINKESILGSVFMTTQISSGKITLSTISTSYNTILPSVRLRDAVAQNIKSISGSNISFPFAEYNGEFYNQRIFNGNLLRNLKDKPFYLSLKEIEDYLPEINGDFGILPNGDVFFGLYADFYANVEIGKFTDIQFDDFEKVSNERYGINEFKFKYKKYQSQKENETENTFDSIHGESEWLLANRSVENKKEILVDWVRDAFSIEEQRRKALDLSETTATQDDDTIYIIDTNPETSNLTFNETAALQHNFDSVTGNVRLNNDSTFSFSLLGITAGSIFKILGSDINAGTYTVVEVGERSLLLNPATAKTDDGNGVRNTAFEYIVLSSTITGGVSWSNEGFSVVDGISETLNFANLKYSLKRNIVRFWSSYLATANLFRRTEIRNTFYKNNPNAVLSYDGLVTVEGEKFTPEDPILSPFVFKFTVITDYTTFKILEDRVRLERGYIRVFDANSHPVKIYPKKMTFTPEENIMEVIGEEKYQLGYINIIKGGDGLISLNSEVYTRELIYTVVGEKIHIFDGDGLLLYPPIFWNKVTVNSMAPINKQELIEWLGLLS